MTEEDGQKLMEFKQRVQDVDHPHLNDPHQVVYFLWALDDLDNLDFAEKWFRKVTTARKESPRPFDSILTEYALPDDYDFFPMFVLDGTDRDGDAIHVSRTGAADCWGLYQRHGKEAMIRHAIFYHENLTRGLWQDDYERKHNGRKTTQYTIIVDMKGLSARHMRAGLIPLSGAVTRILQDTYPELVKRVLVVHAPSIFKLIWGLVKHFFDPDLRELMVFATNDANSREMLEQYIDKDVLPHCLHNQGQDGRVAKGYEHIHVEGGPLPPEGTYQTPQRAKQGLTQAEADAQATSELSDTMITSNVRKRSSSSNPAFVEKRRISRHTLGERPCCRGQFLMRGSYEFLASSTVAQEYDALVKIDCQNHHLVGSN